MQSTGHSLTHERWMQSMHASVITYVMTHHPSNQWKPSVIKNCTERHNASHALAVSNPYLRVPSCYRLQNSVNWRHRVVHLAGPRGFSTFCIKAEHGSLGKYRADSFRGLNTTHVSTHAIARPVPERQMSTFLRPFSVESIWACPSLLITVGKRRDHVHSIAT